MDNSRIGQDHCIAGVRPLIMIDSYDSFCCFVETREVPVARLDL